MLYEVITDEKFHRQRADVVEAGRHMFGHLARAIGELATDPRLLGAKPLGGAGEAAALDHGDESTQPGQLSYNFV